MITISSIGSFENVFTAIYSEMHLFVAVSGNTIGEFRIYKENYGHYPVIPVTQPYLGQYSFVLYMEAGWVLQYRGYEALLSGGRVNDEIWPS